MSPVSFKVQRFFFDRAKVMSRMTSAERRVFSRMGAYVRTRARRSIRKRKKVSEPGQPPSSRTGLLRNFIFFGYDKSKHSVVIGPEKLNRMSGSPDGQPIRGTIPEILERGGTVRLMEEQGRNGQWRRVYKRRNKPIRMRPARMQARPFMGPALQAETKNLSPMWRDAIK